MKRTIIIVLVLILAGVAYVAYPYYALWRLKQALIDKDSLAVDVVVDWPKVRESLREEMMRSIGPESVKSAGASAFGSLGTALGMTMIDRILEAYCNSKSLIELVSKESDPIAFMEKIRTQVEFLSPTQIQVSVARRDKTDGTVRALLVLRGVEWRIERVVLPEADRIRELANKAASPKADRAAAQSTQAAGPTSPKPPPEPEWQITESKSPIDDSPQIAGTLMASEGKGMLLLRCQENRTEAAVVADGYIGSVNDVAVTYRINEDKAVSARWRSSTSGKGAFVPNAITFMRGLPENGSIFIRLTEFSGGHQDSTFKLGKVTAVRDHISATCHWPAQR